MINGNVKKTFLYVSLSWLSAVMPSQAQTFSTGVAPDPQVLVSSPQMQGNSAGQNMEETLVDIKAVDAPTLATHDGKMGMAREERYGQGIIIDADGIIATNRHIIGHAQHIYVLLAGGKIFEAAVLENSKADLCLIKIDTPFPLRAIALADPSEIQVGQKVIAVANAGPNPQRIHGGQIINVFKGISSNEAELLEMDIPLKPGDSGGPILNENGSLLGLIMAKQISDPGKSYAVTCNRIQQEYFKYRNSILN